MSPSSVPAVDPIPEEYGSLVVQLVVSPAERAIDFYVEAPDGLGGFVRHHDTPAIVRAAAPVYLKYGLRNAPELYPVGAHLLDAAVATARERVRRAHLADRLLDRHGMRGLMSPPGATVIGALARFAAESGAAQTAGSAS